MRTYYVFTDKPRIHVFWVMTCHGKTATSPLLTYQGQLTPGWQTGATGQENQSAIS